MMNFIQIFSLRKLANLVLTQKGTYNSLNAQNKLGKGVHYLYKLELLMFANASMIYVIFH